MYCIALAEKGHNVPQSSAAVPLLREHCTRDMAPPRERIHTGSQALRLDPNFETIYQTVHSTEDKFENNTGFAPNFRRDCFGFVC